MQGEFSELGGVSGEGVHSRDGNAEGRSVGEGGGDQETGRGGAEDRTSDDYNALLKKRISSHPLYDKLVGIHLDCLKVSGVGDLDTAFQTTTLQQQHRSEPNLCFPHHFSDLDQFMEAYCLVLSKLREAMEEPQQNATSFVDNMRSQLEEIAESHIEEQPPQTSPSYLSGEASSKNNLLRR